MLFFSLAVQKLSGLILLHRSIFVFCALGFIFRNLLVKKHLTTAMEFSLSLSYSTFTFSGIVSFKIYFQVKFTIHFEFILGMQLDKNLM
jgi:hypothetical protein